MPAGQLFPRNPKMVIKRSASGHSFSRAGTGAQISALQHGWPTRGMWRRFWVPHPSLFKGAGLEATRLLQTRLSEKKNSRLLSGLAAPALFDLLLSYLLGVFGSDQDSLPVVGLDVFLDLLFGKTADPPENQQRRLGVTHQLPLSHL